MSMGRTRRTRLAFCLARPPDHHGKPRACIPENLCGVSFTSSPGAPVEAILLSVKVELRNFRAFDDARPASWKLPDGGFAAFVGVNNSGKSSLLRFFHEARPAFRPLDTPGAAATQA